MLGVTISHCLAAVIYPGLPLLKILVLQPLTRMLHTDSTASHFAGFKKTTLAQLRLITTKLTSCTSNKTQCIIFAPSN